MKHTFLLALAILVCLSFEMTALYAQGAGQTGTAEAPNLQLIGKYSEGRILLRWAPTERRQWEALNAVGYHVERLDLPDNVDALRQRNFRRLTTQALKPAPAAVWEPHTHDDRVAAAYMAVHGELPELPALDMFAQMKQESDLHDNLFFVALSAAELSAQAARLLGLRFEDAEAKPGERYLYRVFPAAPVSWGKVDTAMVFVMAEHNAVPVQPVGIETRSEEKTVLLKWDLRQNRHLFFAYHVERSERPNGPFTRLNKAPLLHFQNDALGSEQFEQVYTDSVGVNYKPFYYHLIGVTPFAEESPPSEVVMGMGRDMTPPFAPAIDGAGTHNGAKALIRWRKEIMEPDLAGFMVGRSDNPEGPFTVLHQGLLPLRAREFIDESPDKGGANYYVVVARDTAGNESRSLSAYVFFPDLTPPEPPTGLTGAIDTNGVVRLSWNPNTERDLMGYRVYWANDASHRFIMISDNLLTEPVFLDTIAVRTLTPNVYYRVTAVDNGFGHSDFSAILELKRPDLLPPAPGVFKDFRLDERGVELKWIPSPSADVASQQLLRRSDGRNWVVLRNFDAKTDSYLDELSSGGDYEYALRAIDRSNLQSELSFPLGVSVTISRSLPPVDDLQAVFNKEKNTMELKWHYPAAAQRRFIIYRDTGEAGLLTYDSVSGVAGYIDRQLPVSGRYRYAVRVVDDVTGRESVLREALPVQVILVSD